MMTKNRLKLNKLKLQVSGILTIAVEGEGEGDGRLFKPFDESNSINDDAFYQDIQN